MTAPTSAPPGESTKSPEAMAAYLATFAREHATTVRVLRAFPPEKAELRPHPKTKTARELAWIFVAEQRLLTTAITTGFDWSQPMGAPPGPPESFEAIVSTFEVGGERVMQLLRDLPPDRLDATVSFFVAPKTLGDIPMRDFLWFMLHDQIHHRGQFSIYLRMADAKVPSIYGPTADEPWT